MSLVIKGIIVACIKFPSWIYARRDRKAHDSKLDFGELLKNVKTFKNSYRNNLY